MTCKPEPIVIVGAGGCGRGVEQLIADINRKQLRWQLLGFTTDDPHERKLLEAKGRTWLGEFTAGDFRHKLPDDCAVAVAIGHSSLRGTLTEIAYRHGLRPATLVHPRALVADHVTLGTGSIVYADSVINVDSVIADHALINFSCVIGHDALWESFVTLAPGVLLGGGVKIGHQAMLNLGARVAPGVVIGPYATVGANSLVLTDVDSHATALGSPAVVSLARPRIPTRTDQRHD